MMLPEAKKGTEMNQIINMIIRQVMNQLIRRGVSAGFDQAAKMGNRKGADVPADPEMDRKRALQARETTRRAQKSMKAMRRMARF